MLMAFEITRHLPLEETEIETPVKETTSYTLSGKKFGLIPILRAGLGMVDGMLNLLPAARIGHVGLYRYPETLQPVDYYLKLTKDIESRELIVLCQILY